MTVTTHTSDDNKSISIAIEDRFDFSLHQKFKESYITCNSTGTHFILELSKTTYMDSSALGMILLLKDHVVKLSGSFKISNPNESVKKVLEIAQFHKLITIE